MTFNKGQQEIYSYSELTILTAEKEIIKAYREAYNKIKSELQKLYLKMQETGVPPQEYYNYMTKFKRLEALQDGVYIAYQQAYLAQKNIRINTQYNIMREVYYRQQYLMLWPKESNRIFALLPDGIVDTAVMGTAETWKQIYNKYGNIADYVPKSNTLTKLLLDNKTKELSKIQQTLTSSFIRGQSYKKTANELKSVFNGSINNAMIIANTEGTRVMNAAALANTNIAKVQGLKIGRTWRASFINNNDSRHQQYDGQIEDKNGMFHINGETGPYPGNLNSAGQNANCKCTIINIVEGIEPQLRRGINPETGEEELISFDSYIKYMDGQRMKYTQKGWVKK